MSDASINPEQGRRRYARTEPDPQLAERNQGHVRARNQELHPTHAAAVDSIVSADMPLEDAARDLTRLRVRQRAARASR